MIQAVHYIGEPATLPVVAIKTAAQIRTRNGFDEQSLTELANSIREVGILEPLIVRRDPTDDTQHIVIAGERRLLAATMAGLAEVPVLIRTADEAQAATLQAIENLQRENLGLADTAEGVAALLKHYQTPKAVAKALGKSVPWVSKHLSITKAPTKVRQLLSAGLTEDAEILLGLAQIARLTVYDAKPAFDKLAAGLDDGTTTRTSVRLALTRLKTLTQTPDADGGDDDGEGEGEGSGESASSARQPKVFIDVTLGLTQSQVDKLQALGGAAWLIAQLDAA